MKTQFLFLFMSVSAHAKDNESNIPVIINGHPHTFLCVHACVYNNGFAGLFALLVSQFDACLPFKPS